MSRVNGGHAPPKRLVRADEETIRQLCIEARMQELADGFVAAGLSKAEVTTELMRRLADRQRRRKRERISLSN